MNSKDIQYITESYSQIVSEQGTDLEALRQAAAKATLAGPSKEAQALMSSRTKTLLGPEKLKAGIEAQKSVEAMKSPSLTAPISSPRPTEPIKPTAPTAPISSPRPTEPTLTAQQQSLYKQAYSNRNNPFAKGRIQSEINKLTPEQKRALQQYAQSQGHGNDWKDYKFESYVMEAESSPPHERLKTERNMFTISQEERDAARKRVLEKAKKKREKKNQP